MVLPGKGMSWKVFFRDLKDEFEKDKVLDIASSLAFFGVLALFPFLIFVVSLAAIIIDPAQATKLMEDLYRVAPPQVADILSERMNSLIQSDNHALLTVSGAGAIWAASGGVSALMDALNTTYDVTDSRPFWKRRGLAILVTIGAAVFMIAASSIAFVTPAIADWIGGPIGTLITWLRMPVAALIVMLVIAVLYYVLPDVEQDFKFITPGSVVAVVLWVAASLGFSFYANNFGSYEASYGAIGGMIVFLMWMWISSIAILLGAEINAVIEHRSPEGKRVVAKSMDDNGADVPKSQKAPEERAAAPGRQDDRVPAYVTAKPAAPQPPRAGAALGIGAVVLGYLFGKRLTK